MRDENKNIPPTILIVDCENSILRYTRKMPKSQYFYLFLHCLIPNRIWSSLPSLHTKGAVNKSKTTVEWRVGEKWLHHNGTPPVSVQRSFPTEASSFDTTQKFNVIVPFTLFYISPLNVYF